MEQQKGLGLQGRFRDFSQTTSFNTYVTIFALNLVHRYPDVTNLDSINIDEVQRVADFSAACTPIVLEVWDRLSVERRRAA